MAEDTYKSQIIAFGNKAIIPRSKRRCTLSVTADNASVVISPEQEWHYSSDNISVTVSPNEGYEISQLNSYSSENVFISGTGGIYTINTLGQGSIVFNIIPSEEQPGEGGTVPDFTYIGAVSGEDTNEFFVNEEVFFSAESTTFTEGVTPDRVNRNGFSWDFGDGYAASGYYGGVSVVHTYTRAGTYSVVLSVLDSEGIASTKTQQVIVTGPTPEIAPRAEDMSKALELRFEQNTTDTSPNANAVELVGTGPLVYIDGVDGYGVSLQDGYLKVGGDSSLDGFVNGFTISFWAKRASYREGGTVLYKANSYNIRFYSSGSSDVCVATIYKAAPDTGTAFVSNWFAPKDTLWHHYVVVLDESTNYMTLYIDGVSRVESGKNPKEFLSDVPASISDLYIGANSSGVDRWNGYIDEIKIFNRGLSEDELFVGFETFHGDFHCRLKQYINYNIPSDLANDSDNSLVVSLLNSSSEETVIYEKTGLSSSESFLLDQTELLADSYILLSRVLDGGDAELDRIEEHFVKGYDNIPNVGIDENNAICINGTPLFPVTSFGLNNANVDDWTTKRTTNPEDYGGEIGVPLFPLINTLAGQGNYPAVYNSTAWQTYIQLGAGSSVKLIGPGTIERGDWATGGRYYCRYTLPSIIAGYVQDSKDSVDLIAWGFLDEPDLGGLTQNTPPAVVRSWTFLAHYYAPEQLTYSNITGPAFVYTLASSQADYSYSYTGTKRYLGRGCEIADILSFDYYPYDWRITRRAQNASIYGLSQGLTLLKSQNPYNPVMSFVETADIRDDVTLVKGGSSRYVFYPDLTPIITAKQVTMLCWLHVVLGFQGVSWFPYFVDFEKREGLGQSVNAVTATNGSVVVTCLKNWFSSAYVGRHIYIHNGTGYVEKVIASCTDGNTIELSEAWEYATTTTGSWYADGAWDIMDNMSIFLDRTSEMSSIILSGETSYTLSTTEDEGLVRSCVRQSGDDIYIFAVRVTEMCGPQPGSTILNSGTASAIIPSSGYYNDAEEWVEYGSIGEDVPVTNKNVSFTMNEIAGKTVTVLYEDRTIAPSGSSFVDDFDVCAVHIYKLS